MYIPQAAHHNKLHTGSIFSWLVFILGIAYAIVTTLGFLHLTSPDDPISDPYFTLMEVLIILIAPLMAITMVAIHFHASPTHKFYSLTAVFLMFIMAGLTTGVHFIILTVSKPIVTGAPELSYLFSFRWPSMVYALDILAWDFFFAFAMLFAAPVFKADRLEKTIRALMIVSGLLSLAGLMGAPLNDMQIRNIGIIGYGVIAPIVFLLIGIILWRKESPSI